MRIIAGQYKGRPLIPPKDQSIRPTSDRTRESLFNLLMHGSYGGSNIIDQPVADLCCGTGALGLEALSRGASTCLFLDRDPTLARTNAERLGLTPPTSKGTSQEGKARPWSGSGMRGDEWREAQEGAARPRPPSVSDREPKPSEPKTRFLTGDIANLPTLNQPVACVFLDAPYDTPFLANTLAQLAPKGWLLPSALICVEQGKYEPLHEAPGLTLIDHRSYGKASIRLYRKV